MHNRKKTMNMMNQPKVKHKFSETWGQLIRFCKPWGLFIGIAIVFAIVGTIFTLIGPSKIQEMVKVIEAGLGSSVDMNKIATIGIMLIIFYASSFVLTYFQGFIMATVTQKVTQKMRKDISQKINRLPLQYFDKTPYGDTLSRVTNDIDTIGQTMTQSLGSLVAGATLFLGSIIMMFVTNYIMALVAIGASLIGFVIMSLIMSRSQKHFVSQQQYLGKINGHIEEAYSGHDVISSFNAQEKFKKDFDNLNNFLYKCAWKAQWLSGLMMPLMRFVTNFAFVAVCVVGALLTMNKTIDFSVVVAFMIYVQLFTQPLSSFAQCFTNLQQTGAASYRVFEFLDENEMQNEDQKHLTFSSIKGNIEFKNIKFGYTDDKTIIKNFSTKIKAGQKIAIVGPTGAGKTTMVNLLMRFYEVNSGQILIDDIPLSEMTREQVHSLFSMVLQDTWIFEGTVKENLVYNKENVSDEEIQDACKAVGVHHFIMTLPKGYDTILNEEASVSAGQRQLITIARAMIQNSPMLILDEATSSVDTRTEILIQKAMDKLMASKTSIVIAHRLSTIKNSDLILVMKDGDIIESGKHQELLAQNGFYATLYNSQFEE